MNEFSSVALSPEELPQQRLVAVRELPEHPPGFGIMAPPPIDIARQHCEIGDQGPTTTLANVEWAWSPMHGRIDTYVLERGETHWLLWNRIAAGVVDEDSHCLLLAAAPGQEIPERTAGLWMLKACLEHDRDTIGLERFHHINHAAFLSVADLQALARLVWCDSPNSEIEA